MANNPAFDDRLIEALAGLAAAFEGHGVHYALIGGLAAGFRSRPRGTRDVDILLTVPQLQLPSLLADLAGRGFSLDERSVIEGFVRHHMAAFDYHGVRIDWLKPVLPAYQHILDRAGTVTGFGHPVRVATAEGLILLKLVAARDQDVADINALLGANREQLDLAWVEQEWLTLFPADDPRWQRFRQAVAEYYDRPGPA
jgi:hypothetical protein